MRLAIIADDLTGAADTGVQLAKRSFYTILLPFGMENAEFSCQFRKTQIVALSTNTRGMKPELAYGVVRDLVVLLKELHPQSIYKKIDSTLRGNVGVEIEAILDATGNDLAVLAPAFPDSGRTTVDGIHLVNGQPLAQTEAASDPVSPVRESHIPTLLGSQTGLRVGHIKLREVRQGPTSLQKAILHHIENGERIIVFDAVTNQDLNNIARIGMLMPSPPLMVGSAGLADQISSLLKPSELLADHPVAHRESDEGMILIISGSLSAITLKQLDEIRRSGKGKVITIETHKLIEDQNPERENDIIAEIISAAGACEAAGFQSVTRNCRYERASSLQVVEYLGRIAGRIVNECPRPIRGLIITGGDTAMAVFKHLGISRVRLVDEILPGVPYGQVVGGNLAGMDIITKAGAFGAEDALVKCVDFLT